jgi:hypothetical protein
VLYALAARRLATDPAGARLLALAGALAFSGIAVLSGFGAGDVTFPAAGLAVLASWAAYLHPPRRAAGIAFLAYVAIGLAAASRGPFFPPWAIGTLFLWPVTALLAVPVLGYLTIFAPFGAAVAVVGAYLARRRGAALVRGRLEVSRRSLAPAALGGAAVVAAFVALALVRTNTSARFELEPVPLVALFAAGALAVLGATALRGAPGPALAMLAMGSAVLLFAFLSRPTVECQANGVGTSFGPWWLAWRGGSLSTEGGGSSEGHSGVIRRGDGVVIRYACAGEVLASFVIER